MKWIAGITSAICALVCVTMAAFQTTGEGGGGWIVGAFTFALLCYFCAQDLS